MSIQSIHEKAIEVARQFKRAEAALIEILQEVDKHKVFLHHGQTSLFGYCTQVLGLSSDVAFNAITVARKSVTVPALKKEIEAGNLSISTARKITPVITKENQSVWIEKAETLTVRELEKEVARVAPKTATPEKAKYVSESRIQLSLGVSEDLMKKLRRIQDLVSQQEPPMSGKMSHLKS